MLIYQLQKSACTSASKACLKFSFRSLRIHQLQKSAYTPASVICLNISFRSLHLLPKTALQSRAAPMAESLYTSETPEAIKNDKGLHLITQRYVDVVHPNQISLLRSSSTPNGQKVQIMLEELANVYGTKWSTTLINIMTNEQKKDWFLRLDPNGRIPVLVDNTQSPPFPVMETSAELLYLLKFADKDDKFGFKDELERNQALQWLFFWHGSGAPYQGQLNHFGRFSKEKIPCMLYPRHFDPYHLDHWADPLQTRSIASKTRPFVSTASSRSSSPANTPASLASTL